MSEKRVGLLGATSLVGQCLLPLLRKNGWNVRAFSRRSMSSDDPHVQWIQIPNSINNLSDPENESDKIDFWISVAPLWVLSDYFSMMEKYGVHRIIVLSSTSRFSKSNSSDTDEMVVARRLSESEGCLSNWAQVKSVDWVILRPTLIYGLGQDKNISEIVRLIRRFYVFPMLGQAKGLRQPVHAEDVATACVSALEKADVINYAYNLSGGETLTYREMINRVFAALGRRPMLIPTPLWLFRLAVALIRCLPHYRNWTMQMADRMNVNLVFDHDEAARDFNYSPGPFRLTSKDLPP